MTDQTLTPGSTDGADPRSHRRGRPRPRAPPTPRPYAASARGSQARRRAGPFRIVTANVQSFPVNAISLGRGARGPAAATPPTATWCCCRRSPPLPAPGAGGVPRLRVGRLLRPARDNPTPIAFRRDALLEGRRAGHRSTRAAGPARPALHDPPAPAPPRPGHGVPRHQRAPDLRARSTTPPPAGTPRLAASGSEGIAEHRRFVESLSTPALPVIGGGDYNRQPPAASTLGRRGQAGKPVTFAVDTAAIDLLWFIDGAERPGACARP